MLTEETNNALLAAAAARENGSKEGHHDIAAAPATAVAVSVGKEPSMAAAAGAVETMVTAGEGGKVIITNEVSC